jgi:hypothetical protein
MTSLARSLSVGTLLLVVLFGAEPVPAQCAAFSTVTFQNYGTACPPVPSCSGTSLYGFYGSCTVSLALFGPTFVGVALGSQATQGIPVTLGGMPCHLWIDQPYVIFDFTGQGLSQVVFTPPPVSLVGLTVFCQALYTVNCGGGPQLGLTDALAVTFN